MSLREHIRQAYRYLAILPVRRFDLVFVYVICPIIGLYIFQMVEDQSRARIAAEGARRAGLTPVARTVEDTERTMNAEREAALERQRAESDAALARQRAELDRKEKAAIKHLCGLKAKCRSYAFARQACALAANLNQCIAVKMNDDDNWSASCTYDGSLINMSSDPTPTEFQCTVSYLQNSWLLRTDGPP